MCQFQKEINSKIQEKKALESPVDNKPTVTCPTESADSQDSNPGVSCDRTSGAKHKLEEAPGGSDGDTYRLEERSSDEEPQDEPGEESVGTACLHDL